MKKHIITIAGTVGSGKSSTAKQLAQRLRYDHFSSGDLFRAIAAESGQDVLQANLSAERNSSIDHLVDQRLREIDANEDNKVIDSRTAWHWMPHSFKVYLTIDSKIAAERIISSMSERELANEHIPNSIEEYAQVLEQRKESENKRYWQLYSIDPSISENYDLVVDTAIHSLGETVNLILQHYTQWIES